MVVRLLPDLGGRGVTTGRADLHIHSLASDGVSSVAEIIGAAQAAGLDVIAITDHDRIEAAVAAQAARGEHEQQGRAEQVTRGHGAPGGLRSLACNGALRLLSAPGR
jgi:hypothetical protein